MELCSLTCSIQRFLLDSLEANHIWLSESKRYQTKQLSRMYHIDLIKGEIPKYLDHVKYLELEHETYKGQYIMVNYLQRDFIYNNGDLLVVTIK